ncbi:flagellar protein FliT [Massilia sp. R2A-15]|uniref:flagellar protein FliT n=1 Tax=Massilia sp. R2A-15 TaxID=3064278 RepID=UPI002736AAA5|nr:flagellar protein FliT [Massilia sp. R2A-15]WLI87968.1 flagellar protein FliT [Massilia sp. R2A-15]
MMTSQQVLSVYETLVGLTGEMVAAASASDWDQLAVLESRCAAHVQALKENAAPVLTGENRARKVRIIQKMLDDDRKIRDLTMPWMAQLSSLISNTRSQGRLVNAYGAI